MTQQNKIYDYTIIGGGPVGLMIAYKLAKQGHEICLLEQNQHFQQNVSMNGGCHSPYYADEPAYRAAQEEALAELDALAAELGVEVVKPYTVQLARTQEEMAEMKVNADYLNGIGLHAVMLAPDEIRQYAPNVKSEFAAAMAGACAYQEPRFADALSVYQALADKLAAMPNVELKTQAKHIASKCDPWSCQFSTEYLHMDYIRKKITSHHVIDASGATFQNARHSKELLREYLVPTGGRALKMRVRDTTTTAYKHISGYFNQWPNAVYLPMGENVIYFEPNQNGDKANLAVTKEKGRYIAAEDYTGIDDDRRKMLKLADECFDLQVPINERDSNWEMSQHTRLMAVDGLPILGMGPGNINLAVAFGGNGWTGAVFAANFYSDPACRAKYASAFSPQRFSKCV